MTIKACFRPLAALTLALVAATYLSSAAAQWAWKDESGRVVYSDRPPPSSTKIQILRQPANSAPMNTAAPDAASKEADKAASSAPKSLAERDMEFRKRQQERADAERKSQEEQQKSASKAADCERARGYLRTLDDGVRIAKTDAAGNREFLDDSQRAAEAARTRKSIETLCN